MCGVRWCVGAAFFFFLLGLVRGWGCAELFCSVASILPAQSSCVATCRQRMLGVAGQLPLYSRVKCLCFMFMPETRAVLAAGVKGLGFVFRPCT